MNFPFFPPQPRTLSGRDPDVVSVLRQAHEEPSGQKRFPGVPAHGVQRGEHAVLVGLWRPQTGSQQEHHWGESTLHLWRLHFHIITKRGGTLYNIYNLNAIWPQFLLFRMTGNLLHILTFSGQFQQTEHPVRPSGGCWLCHCLNSTRSLLIIGNHFRMFGHQANVAQALFSCCRNDF